MLRWWAMLVELFFIRLLACEVRGTQSLLTLVTGTRRLATYTVFLERTLTLILVDGASWNLLRVHLLLFVLLRGLFYDDGIWLNSLVLAISVYLTRWRVHLHVLLLVYHHLFLRAWVLVIVVILLVIDLVLVNICWANDTLHIFVNVDQIVHGLSILHSFVITHHLHHLHAITAASLLVKLLAMLLLVLLLIAVLLMLLLLFFATHLSWIEQRLIRLHLDFILNLGLIDELFLRLRHDI